MATVLDCRSKRTICQDNLLLTEYSLELSRHEIESPGLSHREYVISEDDFELVWAIKTSSINSCWPSLILKSCDSNEIFVNVIVFTRQSGTAWRQQEDADRSLFPDNLQWCRRDVVILNINDQTHNQIKIAFKIYSLNKDAFTDISLIKEEQLSDVTFIVGGEKFAAHKLILSKRSAVFAKMFHCDESEDKKNCIVEIKDVEAETFNLLLEFVYTGHVDAKNHPAVNWLELMLAADKFAVGSLKNICGWKLAEDLSPDNAVDIYILYDRLNEDRLKMLTADFIIANKNKIIHTIEYEKMINLHPNLAIELFRKVMSTEYCLLKN